MPASSSLVLVSCVLADSLVTILSLLGRLLQVDLIKWVSNVRPHVHKVSLISMTFGM